MAALQPHCRLIDLVSNVVLAETDAVLDYQVERALDRVATLSVEIAAGDPGLADYDVLPAVNRRIGFATALLEAAADRGAVPRPLLIELSLDGGGLYDSRKLVDHPARALQAARRTIKEDGPDIFSLLSTVPVERATYTEIALQDVFNAAAGTIVPLVVTGFLTRDAPYNTIPYLAGILTVKPGLDGWDSGARDRLTFVAVIHTDVQNQPTNVDVDSATTLAVCETVVNRLAGAAPLQDYGHYVADCSDAGLNLSGTVSFVPSVTVPRANALVIGNKGSTPSPYIAFDATDNADVDETRTARVHLDASSVTTDDSTLYQACNFVGGRSTAAWPTEGKVTGMAIINTQVASDAIGHGMSGTRDNWEDCVPLIGIDAGDNGGGIYFYMGDGQMRRLYSPGARCLALGYASGDNRVGRPTTIFMATPNGVYYTYGSSGLTGVDLLADTLDWNLLHTNLNFAVSRLQVQVIPTGHIDAGKLAVFALVTGKGDQLDGVWRCTTGSVEWKQMHINPHVLDMVATDFGTFWTLEQATQKKIHRCLYNESTRRVTITDYALPSGKAFALQRVITAAYTGAGTEADPSVPGQDSVWALMAGNTPPTPNSPAYYLVNDVTNTWADHTFYDANLGNTLKTNASGEYPGKFLQVFRAGGLGFQVNGQYVSVLLGTDSGVYWSKKPLGGALDWHSANELGGLGGYDVHNIAAGDYQHLLGDTDKRIWRMFVVTDDDLIVSNSAGRWWAPVRERDRTTMGPHLSQATWQLYGDLPSNKVRTWGTRRANGDLMTTSPISGAATGSHVYIPPGGGDEVPQGYYFERYLDAHEDFQYRLVREGAVFPGLQMSQLPELQSNQAVEPDRASKGVMVTAKRWLQQHADPQTLITVESSFSTVESALRTLRPTHKATLRGRIVVRDVSVHGAITSARVLDFDGDEDLWVLAHTIRKGPGNTATTTTTLAPNLRQTPTSESDIANALSDSIHSVKIWG